MATMRLMAALFCAPAPTLASFWDAVGGALDKAKEASASAADQAQHIAQAAADSDVAHSAMSAVGEAQKATLAAANSSVAQQLEGGGAYLLERTQNATGYALEQAKHAACDMKVGSNIAEVNRTMVSQLDTDCDMTASKLSLVYDQIYGPCESWGLWNINRTLEAQREEQVRACLEMLEKTPHDLSNTLNSWGQGSKQLLSEQVQPAIQGAVAKAQESIESQGDGHEVIMRKYASVPPALRASAPGSPMSLAAVAFLASTFAALAVRRMTPREPSGPLLPLD